MNTASRLSIFVASLATLSSSAALSAEASSKVLNKEQRIERNYELARKLYQGYVNLPKLGYVDAWEAGDYAAKTVLSSFDRTGTFKDAERRWRETTIDKPPSWKDGDREEYAAILKVLPDFHAVTPFKAFCDDTGCALQLCVGGHDKDGKYYEDSEALFFWTNEQGKITRMEVFDDWVNLPDLMGRIAGLPAAEMDYAKWGVAITKILAEDK